IQKGDSVGYERKFKAEHTTKIATLPLGYADGISRIFGNGKAQILVNGKKAPIIGNVCMDTLMVDVTGIDCEEGDEVEVFGKNNTVI
ncbi:alanine racemase, partial [Aquimarina celericrescens]|nr:alanine racemase [Aquimarina celericrescens]